MKQIKKCSVFSFEKIIRKNNELRKLFWIVGKNRNCKVFRRLDIYWVLDVAYWV
jgi:hypothetical protein